MLLINAFSNTFALLEPREASRPEGLLSAQPALNSQRASVVIGRAVQGISAHVISLPETFKSFLSQPYKNTSLQTGRTSPGHYTSFKSFYTAHISLRRIPLRKAGALASQGDKPELQGGTWLAQGHAVRMAANVALEVRPPVSCGCAVLALVGQEMHRTFPNDHLKECIS